MQETTVVLSDRSETRTDSLESAAEEAQAGLTEVLDLVQSQVGLSLRDYRRSTLGRRVITRFRRVGCEDYHQYLHLLASDPQEARHLIEHVTIKWSRFFRDGSVFAQLRDRVLPELQARPDCRSGLNVWSSGCGRGEEVYSLAILLREISAGGQQKPSATIYGTDIDESALAAARARLYPESALADTPPDVIQKYFTARPARFGPFYEVDEQLAGDVRLVHHDLLSAETGPEGSLFHLIMCRNVLIYFEQPAQRRVFDLLTRSLAAGGYLCLGEAEQLPGSHGQLFETVDRKDRLYRRR